jgi:two-component system chemotaxis response regulator CheY
VAVDKGMNVLIVDDYKTMLKIVGNLLRQLGFVNIDEATDGTMALDMFSKKSYGLIISDWNMEPMSGLDLLKNIRAGATNNKVPFIMVTAESKTENVIVAKQAGVNNYIVKPFNAETLKTKLTSVLGEF